MPISEICSQNCGARIDLLPSMPVREARKFITAWRADHRHSDTPPPNNTRPFGFPLPLSEEMIEMQADDEEE